MKEGAGDDPFADAAPEPNEADEEVDDYDEDQEDDVEDLETVGVSSSNELEAISDSDSVAPTLPQNGRDDSGVPWVYTRSNVKDSRDMVQFYLREAVQNAEGDLVDVASDHLRADVSKTDVREAAYVAAMRRPEIVVEELERWGFEASE
ncbi:hypothetical protein [Haloterrigena salifodinae]|uniref:hypothetical protein n=1 Tax=Haloterrigena salifodinae TaxID=2675099 RepID=UPI000F8675B4|nr:hypothetical protein [Haloterrigena salifodinae]